MRLIIIFPILNYWKISALQDKHFVYYKYIVVLYIIINDNTVIGIADDVAIVTLMNIIWNAVTQLA